MTREELLFLDGCLEAFKTLREHHSVQNLLGAATLFINLLTSGVEREDGFQKNRKKVHAC